MDWLRNIDDSGGLTDPNIDMYAPPAAQPLIGIIMGANSDLLVMIGGVQILDDFKIPYELTIISAHRAPVRLHTYAQCCEPGG